MSNKLDQLEFKFEKIIGIQKHEKKLEFIFNLILKYKTIENHALAFWSHNILDTSGVITNVCRNQIFEAKTFSTFPFKEMSDLQEIICTDDP